MHSRGFAELIAVLIGGCLGVGIRYFLQSYLVIGVFPWAVLAVNISGSFAAGFVYASPFLKNAYGGLFSSPVVLVGFLGGLTTFSALALDTVRLQQGGHLHLAVLNLTLNNVFGLLACYLGLMLATVQFN